MEYKNLRVKQCSALEYKAIHATMRISEAFYRAFLVNPKVDYVTKGKDRGEYGHFIAGDSSVTLYELVTHYEVNSLMDLGAGIGLVIRVLARALLDFQNWTLEIKGIENEKTLLQKSFTLDSKLGLYEKTTVIKGDLLKLKKSDIERYDALYFWEPMYSETNAEKFVKVLTNSLTKDQLIFYRCSGLIMEYLAKSDKVKYLGSHREINVFKAL